MAVIKLSLGADEVDFSSARRYAIVSACLKILCTILLIVTIAINTSTAGVDLGCSLDCGSYTAVQTLDYCCMREVWQERQRFEWLNFIFDIIEAVSAFMFMAPMLALGDVFGRRITGNKLMVAAFAASAGVSLLEFLFRAGSTTTANWVSEWSIMVDTPLKTPSVDSVNALRALTIANTVANGQGLWAFAADDLFLGIGLLLASSLTYKFGQLPRFHAHLGLLTGSLAVINFGLELGRFGDWRNLSIVSSVLYAFVGLVLLPAWLIILGMFLGTYSMPDGSRSLTDQMDAEADGALPPAGGAIAAHAEDNTGL